MCNLCNSIKKKRILHRIIYFDGYTINSVNLPVCYSFSSYFNFVRGSVHIGVS